VWRSGRFCAPVPISDKTNATHPSASALGKKIVHRQQSSTGTTSVVTRDEAINYWSRADRSEGFFGSESGAMAGGGGSSPARLALLLMAVAVVGGGGKVVQVEEAHRRSMLANGLGSAPPMG